MQWPKQAVPHIYKVIQVVSEQFIAGQISENEEWRFWMSRTESSEQSHNQTFFNPVYNIALGWIYASLNCN